MLGTALDGKVVLVAGGSTGIGLGVAKAAIARKARTVILLARRDMSALARELSTETTEVWPISLDLRDQRAVAAMADEVRARVGVPDVVVLSSAGGMQGGIDETTPEEFVAATASTVFASFYVVRAFIEDFFRRNSGHIVFIASAAHGMPFGAVAYITRTFGLLGFYESLKADLKRDPDVDVRLTWCEPPFVLDNSYVENHPGLEKQAPIGMEKALAKTGMTTVEIGARIAAAIEAGKPVWRPTWMTVLAFLVKHTPLGWLFANMPAKYLPPEEGGPKAGHRRRLYAAGEQR